MSRQARSALWLLLLVVLVVTRPGPAEYAAWLLRRYGVSSPPLIALGSPLVASTTKAYDLWLVCVYVTGHETTLGIFGNFVPIATYSDGE